MAINQGDIYWIRLDEPAGTNPDYAHPYVVVQDDLFNHSRIDSLVVCALSTNLKMAALPGNVLLESGEANLEKPSVVVVSKISAVTKTQLGGYIGTLDGSRIKQILAGIRFLQTLGDRPPDEQ
jgi:mRNA interferase MazF